MRYFIRGKGKQPLGIVVKQKEFALPVEGLPTAAITRIEDVGQAETQHGTKDKARIFFTMLDQKRKEGNDVDAFISVNKVLSEKSTLGKLLKSIKINPDKSGFDLDDLIGIKCQVVIQHNERDCHEAEARIAAVLRV